MQGIAWSGCSLPCWWWWWWWWVPKCLHRCTHMIRCWSSFNISSKFVGCGYLRNYIQIYFCDVVVVVGLLYCCFSWRQRLSMLQTLPKKQTERNGFGTGWSDKYRIACGKRIFEFRGIIEKWRFTMRNDLMIRYIINDIKLFDRCIQREVNSCLTQHWSLWYAFMLIDCYPVHLLFYASNKAFKYNVQY